jgi:hypothetical protein
VIALPILLFLSSIAFATDGSDFIPASLSQVSNEMNGAMVDCKKLVECWALDPRFKGYESAVAYTGESRKLTAAQLRFIVGFNKSVLRNATWPTLHSKQIRITENGKSYWLAVQDKVYPYLEKELKKGQQFKITYRFAGMMSPTEPALCLIEFESEASKKKVAADCRIECEKMSKNGELQKDLSADACAKTMCK